MYQLTVAAFSELDLGDKRRDERFVSIINNVTNNPGSSIPTQNDSWYDAKATYSFYKNESVTIESLSKAISAFGGSKISGIPKLLIAHDFCQISFNKLEQTEGLGYLAHKDGRGIFTYNSIGISTDGTPLSLLYQHSFIRPLVELGKAKNRRETPYEDKESYHWYKGFTTVNELLDEGVQKIHIADREADIFELFFASLQPNSDILLRARYNRKTEDGNHLWDELSEESNPPVITIKIPEKKGHKLVDVEVSIRFKKVTIVKPEYCKSPHETIELTAILLQQISPKQDWQEETIDWRLLTSLAIETVADALQCVQWYCYRWLIERFHYVLKSGTKIEELQLKRAEGLQKAIHLYSLAAMLIMQMVYQSRATPDVSCEVILTKEQWIVLYILTHKTTEKPTLTPTLGEAVKWIGKLGGHLGRKSDGPPGLKVVWRGYQRLINAQELYNIMDKNRFG